MASRMRIRAQLKEDYCEVKALMRHPMETGMRKDQSGAAIPANFIED
ncbi:MAG: thiosulfate oxidation carrier complex protein SoxZ, partial [Halieaceae bacterium]|nr:thiosulfate oxidation carrier complex protein SoxZ [Halieaceae bacterium]